jgi:hypothetical protein
MLEINLPDVVAEVTLAFMSYQEALDSDDLEAMEKLFWNSPRTLRYAHNGTLLGHAAIAGFRRGRKAQGTKAIPRALKNTVITTFGRDFAVTNTETARAGSPTVGRQTQAWVRMPEGWRIVTAHVSDQPGTT